MNKEDQRDRLKENFTGQELMFRRTGDSSFKYLKWVLTAVDDQTGRAPLWCLALEGKKMLATDGKRLHRCNRTPRLQQLRDGLWWPGVNKADEVVLYEVEGLRFPDYEHNIPRDGEAYRMRHEDEFVTFDREGVLQLRVGVAMATSYIRDALWGGDIVSKKKKAWCDVFTARPRTDKHGNPQGMLPGPVTFHFPEGEDRFAMIMPINIT